MQTRHSENNPNADIIKFEQPTLICPACGEDLLHPDQRTNAMLVRLEDEQGRIIDIFSCHCGDCYKKLVIPRNGLKHHILDDHLIYEANPQGFMRMVWTTIKGLADGSVKYSPDALDKLLEYLYNTFVFCSRSFTLEESEFVKRRREFGL
jgi:hypothetical protein